MPHCLEELCGEKVNWRVEREFDPEDHHCDACSEEPFYLTCDLHVSAALYEVTMQHGERMTVTLFMPSPEDQ